MVEQSWPNWAAAHGEPLLLEGALAVWRDGAVTIDVGDEMLRPLGRVVAEGAHLFGRVALRVDLVAKPARPAGRGEPAAEPADDPRLHAVEKQRDDLQDTLAPLLDDPWVLGPDGRFCVLCGKAEHADDCAVRRRDELLQRGCAS